MHRKRCWKKRVVITQYAIETALKFITLLKIPAIQTPLRNSSSYSTKVEAQEIRTPAVVANTSASSISIIQQAKIIQNFTKC